MPISTNRELYRAVLALNASRRDNVRPLVEYLGALRALFASHHGAAALTPDEFVGAVEGAFAAPPRDLTEVLIGAPGFHRTDERLAHQIASLAALAATGALDGDEAGFGVEGPDGERWSNLDPFTFLECGIAGAFDGWDAESDAALGPLGTLGEDGLVRPLDAAALRRNATPLGPITWDGVTRFLECGQSYE